MREAGRATARLVLRRTAWLLVFAAATWPLWSGHYVGTLAMTGGH